MQTAERAHDIIVRNNKTFAERLAAGDTDGVAALYTVDAAMYPPNLPTFVGREAISAFWKGMLGLGVASVELNTDEVEEVGSTAIECGNFRALTADGTQADHGTYIVVWHLNDGEWRLHRDIFNSSQEA